MNKRIKELLLQNRNSFTNGVTDTIGGVYIHGSQENLEKFAELIVRECCLVIRNDGSAFNNMRYTRAEIANMIEEHFKLQSTGEKL